MMKMPKSCKECPYLYFYHDEILREDFACCYNDSTLILDGVGDGKHENCPLVEVEDDKA